LNLETTPAVCAAVRPQFQWMYVAETRELLTAYMYNLGSTRIL